jgi:hypothetical protein
MEEIALMHRIAFCFVYRLPRDWDRFAPAFEQD